MRFAKPLTTGILSAALLVVPFAGSSFAATAAQAPAQSQSVAQGQVLSASKVSIGTVGLGDATGVVVAGDKYQIQVNAPGVKDGTVATLQAPNGKVYKLRLNKGKATKVLTLPRNFKPGNYKYKVIIAGKTTTANCVVTQRDNKDDSGHNQAA